MQRALELASNACGGTRPNPMVGAVIVHNNKILRSFSGVVACLVCSWCLPLLTLSYTLVEGFDMETFNETKRTQENLSFYSKSVHGHSEDFLMDISFRNYSLPEAFLLDEPTPVRNTIQETPEERDSFVTCLFMDRFHFNQIIINIVIHLIIPAFIITFCYVSIFKQSHTLSSRLQVLRRSTMNRRRRDQQLLRLCLVLLCMFLLGYGPFAVVRSMDYKNKLLLTICTFIYCLAFSNNGIIYGLLNTQFRYQI